MARSDTNEKETRRRKSAGFRILYILFILLDLAAGCALAVTGYAGYVSPLKHGGLWGVLPLGFGYAFWLCIALLVLQLLFYRRGALVLAILMLCSAGPVLTFFPVNAGTSEIPPGSESFTFLTYNVHNFVEPGQTESTDTMHNAQVEYILKTDADIVCLQEATWVGTFRPKFLAWNQREKLFENYPYVYVDGAELAVLSKFPVEAKHLDASSNFKSGHVICLHVTLPSSRIITVFDVHLQSMRLLNEDREVYMQMTELHRPHIHDIKNKLFDKLSEAAINRAEGEKQANILRAEGVAQARILEADGEKEAIQRIINALADKGQPDKYLIAMKYLETMKTITSGKDNKIVYMPYEATGILSSVDGIKQMFSK